ncbi:MAG: hypothetical protein JWN99_2243 [Ilumatobacteraceae bacterium]|nr:hypothetical protein [Ilumatobacteraceae bacterium]
MTHTPMTDTTARIELSWIPLGAGGRVVRFSGRTFEALSAMVQRRRPCDLYHSALTVSVPEGRFVIEMTPIPDGCGGDRGVVAEGPVGLRLLGRLRLFRYEIRRWCGGDILDAAEAECVVYVSHDPIAARHLLDLVPLVPTPVWGRDELDAGEMWNSNSVTAWLLACSSIDLTHIAPPAGGRAPGWNAGLVVASRMRQNPVRLRGRAVARSGGTDPDLALLHVQTTDR